MSPIITHEDELELAKMEKELVSQLSKLAKAQRTLINSQQKYADNISKANIIRDMPFPIPLSEICSPSHMIKTVPVVIVRIVRSLNPQPGFGTIGRLLTGLLRLSKKILIPKDWIRQIKMVP